MCKCSSEAICARTPHIFSYRCGVLRFPVDTFQVEGVDIRDAENVFLVIKPKRGTVSQAGTNP